MSFRMWTFEASSECLGEGIHSFNGYLFIERLRRSCLLSGPYGKNSKRIQMRSLLYRQLEKDSDVNPIIT